MTQQQAMAFVAALFVALGIVLDRIIPAAISIILKAV